MSHSAPPEQPSGKPGGDPWRAVGYLITGVGLYGFLGWLADRWLGTSFLVGIGIVVGAALGIYLTIMRFKDTGSQDEDR